MKLEKFKEVTEQGCDNILQTLSNLDGNLTVKEITDFLTKRKEDAKSEIDKEKRELIQKVVGKYFFIDYSRPDCEHNVLIYIESVNFISKFGEVDAELIGEAMILYGGEVRFDTKLNTYSNYRLDTQGKEITASQFTKLKHNHTQCLATFHRLRLTKA